MQIAHAARRLSNRVYLRFITVFAIFAILLPMIFVGDERRASAKPVRNASPSAPPNNAPPQAFKIGSAEANTLNVSLAVSMAGLIGDLFGASQPHPGFKLPEQSFTEKMSGFFSPVLAIFAAKKAEAVPPPPSGPTAAVDFDFDGDGRSDIGRWHPSTTEFKIKNSNGGSISTYTLGTSSGKSAPADYDGDGTTDVALFDAGTWTIRKSSDGSTITVSGFGQAGDIPVSGNYTGSGTDDNLAVYRPSTGYWYHREVGNTTVTSVQFGASSDMPAAGDYDGDGKMDQAVYRPGTGEWFVNQSTAGFASFNWGNSIDIPVPADFDGDGQTDIAIFRPSNGQWWVLFSEDNYTTHVGAAWGNVGDQPVAGDFDGDNKADLAVWRPTSGRWLILLSGSSGVDYQTLGVNGDTALASSFIKQVGSSIPSDEIAKARLQPKNATGGTNLYSQNFSWGTSLVGLPGRSGLDLGVGLSYNSLVWTKVNSSMLFDTNADTTVSPGFRVGLPTIEPAYYNDDTDKFNYLMVTPGGARVEFRQQEAGNTYETYDSSYAFLHTSGATSPNDPVENITIGVTGTDGTQMVYVWNGGAFRCVSIKDRNGNYISIAYDPYDNGTIQTMTDTLGRVLTFNYDSTPNLTSITQTWKGSNGLGSNTTHTWATFTYATKTLATDFHPSLTAFGPPNGTNLKVLEKVTYPDGSFTKFHYNGYAQVWKIENIAADSTSHVLNRVRTNLESPSADQTDCPRFTKTWSLVENFNADEETVSEFTITPSQTYSLPGSITGSATLITAAMEDHPHNAISKTYVHGSGLFEGLPIATEDWADGTSGSERKRWTWTEWDQDDPYAARAVNPRVVEARVGDSANIKKTKIKYEGVSALHPASTFGLVKEVQVFAADQTTIIKKATTEYDLSSTYTDRRVIGLPSKTEAWGWNDISGTLEYVSKVTYAYDEGDFSDSGLSQNISPVQHDSTYYGSSSIAGRGNLTSTTRWNVEYPTNSAYAVSSSLKYNTAGAVVSKTTPWDGTNTRTVKIGYADVWNDSVSRTTYAYPTSITDPANISSTVKYRYDIGTNVEANSPAPAGQTFGKTTKRAYDTVGRLERDSVYVNTTEHSYVRYEFPTNGVQSKVYAPIVDVDGDGNIAEDEVYSESWSDGAGRTLMSRTEHPGSSGGWSATLAEYDILGRVTRQSVPTETNSSYEPAGDDLTRGFLWTHQKYDWMGRVVRKINTDGTDSPTLNDTDVLISYEGCGCAGGLVTTVEGELVPRTDITGNARRKQKSYADILGRAFKTETFEWDGDVYSTVHQSFNGRDQVLRTRQFAGNTSSTTYQDTTATFDGHGRTVSSHKPEQRDASDNLKYTTYNYNPDDSILNTTDGRGAVTNFEYNSRGLLTEKSWTVPGGSGITDPTDVTYTYDNLGNRTQMTDGLGTQTYTYDELSRMTGETRVFSDEDTPFTNDTVALTYTYTIGGQLKSYATPFVSNLQVNYAFDKAGRLSVASGTSGAGNFDYADNPLYRAWGALTHLDYGNGTEMNVGGFNNKLQATTFEVKKGTTQIINKTYQYNNDGLVKFEDDNIDAKFDRSYEYDQVSRMNKGLSGAAARGETITGNNTPYRKIHQFDAFGHHVQSTLRHWGNGGPSDIYTPYTNNRRSGSGYSYDSDGNMLHDSGYKGYKYSAAAQLEHTDFEYLGDNYPETYEREQEWIAYDGNGSIGKIQSLVQDEEEGPPIDGETAYKIRSTVMGGKVVYDAAAQAVAYVYAGGDMIARHTLYGLMWEHKDPNMKSYRSTIANGSVNGDGISGLDWDKIETDADGSSVGLSAPVYYPTESNDLYSSGWSFGSFSTGQSMVYVIDGIHVPADFFMSRIGADRPGFEFEALYGSIREVGRWYRRTITNDGPNAGGSGEIRIGADTGWVLREIVYDTSWVNLSLIPFQTQRQAQSQTQQKKSCVFNINLSAKSSKLTNEQLDKVKKRMQKFFTDAGHSLVFNDPEAAGGTEKGSYDLTIDERFASENDFERENRAAESRYINSPQNRFFAELTLGFTDNSFFGGIKNRGTVAVYWTKYSLFGRVKNHTSEDALITAVATVGVHEAAHYFLRKIHGNFQDGHSKNPGNILSESSNNLDGSEGFSAEQRVALSSWCNKK